MNDGHIPAAILQAATLATGTDRPNTHGDAIVNHDIIAAFWTTYILQRRKVAEPGELFALTAADAAQMMVLFKIARTISGDPTHVDHYVDAAGYTAIAARCAGADPAPIREVHEHVEDSEIPMFVRRQERDAEIERLLQERQKFNR